MKHINENDELEKVFLKVKLPEIDVRQKVMDKINQNDRKEAYNKRNQAICFSLSLALIFLSFSVMIKLYTTLTAPDLPSIMDYYQLNESCSD
jgi:hypothetical protein